MRQDGVSQGEEGSRPTAWCEPDSNVCATHAQSEARSSQRGASGHEPGDAPAGRIATLCGQFATPELPGARPGV